MCLFISRQAGVVFRGIAESFVTQNICFKTGVFSFISLETWAIQCFPPCSVLWRTHDGASKFTNLSAEDLQWKHDNACWLLWNVSRDRGVKVLRHQCHSWISTSSHSKQTQFKSIRQSLMFQYISLAKIPMLVNVAELLRYWPRRSCLARPQSFLSSFISPTSGRPTFKKCGFEPISSKYRLLLGVYSEALEYFLHEDDLKKT